MNVIKIIEGAMSGFSAHSSNYGQNLAMQERKRNAQRLRNQGLFIRIVRALEDGNYYRVLVDQSGKVVKILNRVRR